MIKLKCSRNFSLLLILFFEISSLMVVLERNKEYCIIKDVDAIDTLKISYMVSGEKEDSINIQLKDSDDIIYYNNQEKNSIYKDSGEFSLNVNNKSKNILIFYKKDVFTLCFNSLCPKETVISFEFFTLNESGHILNLANNGN